MEEEELTKSIRLVVSIEFNHRQIEDIIFQIDDVTWINDVYSSRARSLWDAARKSSICDKNRDGSNITLAAILGLVRVTSFRRSLPRDMIILSNTQVFARGRSSYHKEAAFLFTLFI